MLAFTDTTNEDYAKFGDPTWRALLACMRANVPVAVTGHPGIAKTAKVVRSFKTAGWYVTVVVGSIRQSVDFNGLPYEHLNESDNVVEMRNMPVGWAAEANRHEKSLIVLDEFNLSEIDVFKASLRMLQERHVGDLELGEHVRILALMNPPSSATDAIDLFPAVANRFVHLPWFFDRDEWCEHVFTDFANVKSSTVDDLAPFAGTPEDRARAGSLVVGFVQKRPDLHDPAPPTDVVKASVGWASPRSWHNLVKVLTEIPADDEVAMGHVVKGLIGEETMKEFYAWLRERDLHDPAEVIKNPSIVDWTNERPDRLYGLFAGMGAYEASQKDPTIWRKTIEALVFASKHSRLDVTLPLARDLLNRVPSGLSIPKVVRETYSDILAETQHGFETADF